MNEQINLQDITDVKELKAMTYDQTLICNAARNNIQALEQRMMELHKEEQEQASKAKKTK